MLNRVSFWINNNFQREKKQHNNQFIAAWGSGGKIIIE
jgi:hypothetical protein